MTQKHLDGPMQTDNNYHWATGNHYYLDIVKGGTPFKVYHLIHILNEYTSERLVLK